MLSISDLNQVIKHYAYHVQQRIDDLDRLHCPLPQSDENQHLELLPILTKYANYQAHDEKQTRLAQKLVERILQIFDFFKAKSKNQNLLTLIHQKINLELKRILDKNTVHLGELFSYIRLIAKPGGVIKVPAQNRRVLSKSIIRQPPRADNKISPTLSLFNIQRRGTSLITPSKHMKTQSLCSQKWKMDEILNGVWSCLQVQKMHLVRVKEGSEPQGVKDMLRRNEKTLACMKQYERRWRMGVTETSEPEPERTILSEMRGNIRSTWTNKRKRIGLPRKHNHTLKENISIIL